MRNRLCKAYKAQKDPQANKTFDLLGCFHSFFKSWNIHHLYGKMTLENYGSTWQIDLCLPIASFNLLDENDIKKRFNWIKLRPISSSENNSKNAKINYHLYLLQEVKSKYFLKFNEEGPN